MFSKEKKRTRHLLFTVVSVCMCWRLLKPVDYVMLSEQSNDVYCARQATFFGKKVSVCLVVLGGVVGGEQSAPKGGGTGEVERLTVTGV